MVHIPISFDYREKHYDGFLIEVCGAASARLWHLTIDNYHYGQLMIVNGDWVFHSNSGEMKDIAWLFGEHLMLWYQ